MELRFLLAFTAVLACSCNSAKLANRSSGAAGAVGSGDSKSDEPYTGDTANPPPAGPPPTDPAAREPITIGGSYLTCGFQETETLEVQCQSSDVDGNPVSFQTEKAFFISGSPALWRQVSFEVIPNQVGKWRVKLPELSATSFGIAVVDDRNAVLMDFIDLKSAGFNLVGNPSFELNVSVGSEGYKYFAADPGGAWQFEAHASSSCPTPVLEIQSVPLNGQIPPDGKHWAEIDSSCTLIVPDPTPDESSGNITLYQDIATQPGHFYQVVFSYSESRVKDSLKRFRASFDGQILFERDSKAKDWIQLKSVKQVLGTKSRLSFDELGLPDHYGTLIDDVKVIDMGSGP